MKFCESKMNDGVRWEMVYGTHVVVIGNVYNIILIAE